MRGIEGKIAIVTGGAQGIGKAISERFLEERAHVVIVDMIPEIDKSFEEIKKRFPTTKGFPIRVDYG